MDSSAAPWRFTSARYLGMSPVDSQVNDFFGSEFPLKPQNKYNAACFEHILVEERGR